MSPCLPKCSNDDPRMHVTRDYKAEQSQEIKMPNLGVGDSTNFKKLQFLYYLIGTYKFLIVRKVVFYGSRL